MKGSYTIEAAVIMSIFCLMMTAVLHQAYKLHDETVGKMALHERIEQGRRLNPWEREQGLAEIDGQAVKRKTAQFSFKDFRLQLGEKSGRIVGKFEARKPDGQWNIQIEAGIFEPEVFLRKTEAVKQLEAGDGSLLRKTDAP